MDVAAILTETTTISTNSHRITAIIAPLDLDANKGNPGRRFKNPVTGHPRTGKANRNIATKVPRN